jgi:nodulation protein E
VINRRVAITGIGVISALGNNKSEFWHALCEGRSGIAPIESVDRTLLRFENGAEIRNFNPLEHFEEAQLNFLDRFSQFALVAAREAVLDAQVNLKNYSSNRTAVVTGVCHGGLVTEDEMYFKLYHDNQPRVSPLTIPRIMASAGTSCIAMELGITGPTYTLSTACSSSAHAIGHAFRMVRDGYADLVITGGSEAPFSLGNLKAWEALRVVADDTCRPFSKDRRGMILGEGSAMLVLEPIESALARDTQIYAEIAGFGMSTDTGHMIIPSEMGAVSAMRAAMEDSNANFTQIEYINAHGTGTLSNDKIEIQAVRSLFGKQAEQLSISSTKSAHGHTLGAAGAIESASTILALSSGILPPTVNFVKPDPECSLDVVPNKAREKVVEYALSNSFAFGGLNAVLLFRRWSQ